MEKRGTQEVPVAFCTTSATLHFGGGEAGKRRKKEEGADLCWPVRNYLTTPV